MGKTLSTLESAKYRSALGMLVECLKNSVVLLLPSCIHSPSMHTQIRAYISTFNLKGDAQEKRIRDLSGGERNRVYMARQLKEVSGWVFWLFQG